VIREAIVNAVAHRDYTSNGSVQVMVFADRVEVWNPGSLPPSLSLAQLRQPHGSIPANPLLAEPLYLTQYIERLGTGTGTAAPGKASISREQILAMLRSHPEFTIAELARQLILSDSGVEYNLRKLRQVGRIRREGSTKSGRWVVVSP
jgi:predicted HTH transcriptional regulator